LQPAKTGVETEQETQHWRKSFCTNWPQIAFRAVNEPGAPGFYGFQSLALIGKNRSKTG
jgi:hypothetical protein